MFRTRLITILIVILAISISVLACGSSEDTQPTTPPTDEAEVITDVPIIEEKVEATEEIVPPTATSEPLMDEEIIITALSIVDPDEPGLLYSPVEGKHLVSIEIVVENMTDDTISVNPLDTSLIDSQGLAYMVELGSSEFLDQIETLDLYPGERVQGWVSFSIEDGASPAKLKYELNMWNGETLEMNLSELSPPPEWQKVSPILSYQGLGEESKVSDYSLTALSVVDPANPGVLYSPVEGVRLISVEIVVKNETGSDTLSVNPLNAYLVDDFGFVYGVELGGSDLEQIDTLDLSAGEAAKGFVTFEVPEGRAALYLRYVTDFWGFEEPLVVGLK